MVEKFGLHFHPQKNMNNTTPLVSIVMGSKSDWETMKNTVDMLNALGIPNEYRVASAHRTPQLAMQIASEAAGRGVKVIIAAAGGAAHLDGANARRHSRRHARHRFRRCEKRRAARRQHPRSQRRKNPRRTPRLPRKTNARRDGGDAAVVFSRRGNYQI